MGQERRLAFHSMLLDLLGEDGNVYFQPPTAQEIQYPCIVYERDNVDADHADNIVYYFKQRYQVTYIDHNPDGDPIDALIQLPLSAFSRHFVTSGLNHDVFSIYY